jgi:hypothetical protein
MMKVKSIRPAIMILLVLALGAVTLEHLADGSVPVTTGCLRLAGAIVVSWAGVSLVGSVVDSYRLSVLRRQQEEQAQPPSGL